MNYQSTLASIFSAFLLLPLAAVADTDLEKFPGIEALMKEDKFNAAGLHRLSPAELKTLNSWLVQYTASDAQIVKQRVKEVRTAANKEVVSSIKGDFYGWKGKTIFRLDNDQVWQQRYKGLWKTNLNSPKVIIRKNFLGFHEMEIVNEERSIGVKRIQ